MSLNKEPYMVLIFDRRPSQKNMFQTAIFYFRAKHDFHLNKWIFANAMSRVVRLRCELSGYKSR